MLKKFVKFICVVLCIAMLLPFTAVAEGNIQGRYPWVQEPTHHTDITEGSWYANNCRFVYHYGYMTGTSDTEFSPHKIVTREMAVFIIENMVYGNSIERPERTCSGNYFKDIEPDQYYSNSIQWAYEKGITAGIGDGYFGIGQPITRQDFLVMLYHTINKYYYQYIWDEIKPYDGDDVSDYAREAAGFFISGYEWRESTGEGVELPPSVIFAPPGESYRLKDYLTRAEAATMIAIYTCGHNYKIIGWSY